MDGRARMITVVTISYYRLTVVDPPQVGKRKFSMHRTRNFYEGIGDLKRPSRYLTGRQYAIFFRRASMLLICVLCIRLILWNGQPCRYRNANKPALKLARESGHAALREAQFGLHSRRQCPFSNFTSFATCRRRRTQIRA
jgi:hypothetical protein